jgi:hypothetical protein
MATALIALEGVLKTEIGAPIPEGIKLFRILAEQYRVVIASDLAPDLTEHWLRSNMIFGYAEVYDNRFFFEGQDLRARHLAIAKSAGKVDLFIDPDADRCAMALANGVTTILFAAPQFIRTSREAKSWTEVSEEVERQRMALLDAEQNKRKSGRFE